MTKRTRTILFLFSSFLFFLVAPATIFYSYGYKIDFNPPEGRIKITQTGALYFKVYPKSVKIYLNEKLAKKTDFFFGSGLIENLLPKKYSIEIKKTGFHSWRKNLEIREKEVTEAKNVVLIPENIRPEILASGVKDFFFSPDGKKSILREEDKDGWSLKLFDTEKKVKSHLIYKKEISNKKEVEFFNLKFSYDSQKILLEVGVGEELKYYILEINKSTPTLISLDFLNADIKDIFFNPENGQELITLKKQGLAKANFATKKISQTFPEKILALSILDNNIYYLNNLGFLSKTDFSFSFTQKINNNPLPIKEELSHKIKVLSPYYFVQEGEILYFFDKNEKSFEKLFEPVNDFGISPNSKKIVYSNNSEVWILFLEEELGQPPKKAGETLFLNRFSEKIGDVSWLTSHYLIFNTEDKIKITEIDDRDGLNIVDLATFKNPKIFWNDNNKKLYILSNETFFVSEKLIP
ncbi:hypothetical protein ACFL11_00965 [Patescibacteria group bacterium]